MRTPSISSKATLIAILMIFTASLMAGVPIQDDEATCPRDSKALDSESKDVPKGSRFDSYVLLRADAYPKDDPTELQVQFGSKIPEQSLRDNIRNWRLRREDNLNSIEVVHPTKVRTAMDWPSERIVCLSFQGGIDISTAQYELTFLGGRNLAQILVGGGKRPQTSKPSFYTAALGKSDADLYLSGTVTGAKGSGPLYSIEAIAKVSKPTSSGDWGGGATFTSDEGADIDPDSITASATWSKVIVIDTATGLILNSNFAGGEFDKKGETRNFKSDLTSQFVLPPISLSESAFAAFDFTAGFEAGHNFEHKLNPDGLGGFWRWVVGANARMIVFRPWENGRIDVSGEYRLRLPRSAEPFTEKLNGLDMTSLTRKPRHYVGADVDFMLSRYMGVTLKFRYGSLPPAFSFVDHRVSAGLTFKAKQSQ